MAKNDALLGRVAVAAKMLTIEQLNDALAEIGRNPQGRNLGQVLIDRGDLTDAQLTKVLEMQRQVVARARAKRAAEAGPSPAARQSASGSGREPRPASEPAGTAEPPAPPPKARATPTSVSEPAPRVAGGKLDSILREAVEAGASDLHLHSGAPIKLRAQGQLFDHGSGPLAAAEAKALIYGCLTGGDRALFEEFGEHDFAYSVPGLARFRVNAYQQLRGIDAAFRIVPETPPTLDALGLPSSLARFTTYHQGMVLVTGPTSCGKTSTLAAIVNLINEERAEHILTIEDPIEYRHGSQRCLVNQRSVRKHTESFARALRGALREDPDIIVIGELRDRETIGLALTAAETGHFVLATMHTDNSIRTLNRLVGAFPPEQQDQVRAMLSGTLKAVISQRLLPLADESGRTVALETLVINRAVGNLLRDSKTVQIRSVIQTGAAHGMVLLEQSMAELVRQKRITREEALRHAEDPKLIGGGA